MNGGVGGESGGRVTVQGSRGEWKCAVCMGGRGEWRESDGAGVGGESGAVCRGGRGEWRSMRGWTGRVAVE